MEEELRKLVEYAEKDIFACSSPNDLLNVKAKYLGKKSLLSSLYAQMRNIPVEERPAFGNLINEAKKRIEDLLEQQNKVIKENAWKKKRSQSRHRSYNAWDFQFPGWLASFNNYPS